jgi:hypothetical protein
VYDKYKGEGFTFEVVELCERERLRKLEQEYINNETGELFNLAKEVCDLAPPEEHSKRMKGAWAKRTPEQKAAMSAKISATLKRRYRENPDALKSAQESLVKGRASKALKERKHTPEANEKRRQASLRQWGKRSEAERLEVGKKISSGMKASTA